LGQAFKASAALDPKPPESRELSYAKKKKTFTITSNLWYMQKVLNVDEIKN
jgi:hypothetical protein